MSHALTLVELLGFLQKLLLFLLDNWHLKNLVTVWSSFWIYMEHHFDHAPKINRIVLGDSHDLASTYSLEETLHAACLKWRLQGDHLIQNTAKRPYI